MEVYFIECEDSGKRILHKYECSDMNINQVKFLGLFNHQQAALKGALDKYSHVSVCKGCCTGCLEQNGL